jgi:hypothetical protein
LLDDRLLGIHDVTLHRKIIRVVAKRLLDLNGHLLDGE